MKHISTGTAKNDLLQLYYYLVTMTIVWFRLKILTGLVGLSSANGQNKACKHTGEQVAPALSSQHDDASSRKTFCHLSQRGPPSPLSQPACPEENRRKKSG